MDAKNSADLHLQVDRSADRHITAGRLKSLELDYHCLISRPKYCTISRYHNTERHDISISSLGYDMNPRRKVLASVMPNIWLTCIGTLHYNWSMSVHASQAFNTYTSAHDCTDSEHLPLNILWHVSEVYTNH